MDIIADINEPNNESIHRSYGQMPSTNFTNKSRQQVPTPTHQNSHVTYPCTTSDMCSFVCKKQCIFLILSFCYLYFLCVCWIQTTVMVMVLRHYLNTQCISSVGELLQVQAWYNQGLYANAMVDSVTSIQSASNPPNLFNASYGQPETH